METHTTGWGAFQNMKQENIRLKSEIEILHLFTFQTPI